MLTINDKTYRNLEEQVQKNMCDIKALMFGLKVVGQVANVPDLPSDIKVGETILVGTDRPYYFYMKIGEPKNYLNLGTLESTIPGPKGEPGEKGEPGKRGSHWKVGPTAPTINGDEQEGDLYLNVLNGNVYAFKNDKWTLYGTIKGPQGAIGPQGDIGPEGAQGAIGPVGPQGSSGISYRIIDILDLISELPLPSTAQPNDAYLVKEGAPTQDSQNMYILVKGLWTNIGPTHLDQEAINELYMILAENYDDLNGQILVVKNDIEAKTNHNMLNWGFGPEATTKKEFYSKVGQVFVNKPTQSIYMYGEPEQLNAHFFDIWGKPEGFKATHAFVSIRPLSNEHSRVSFKMYLNSSNYGTTYEMTVSGYAGTYVGDSGWYNITKISEEFKSQYDFLYSEIGRVDGRIDSNELWINEHTKAIQTHGKQITNLNTNVANIYDLIGATSIQEVEEDYVLDGNPKIAIPATVQVNGQPQTVVDNQKFKISRIKGNTARTSDNKLVYCNVSTITAVGTNRFDENLEILGGNYLLNKDFIPVKPSTQYHFRMNSLEPGLNAGIIYYYNSAKELIKQENVYLNQLKTMPENCYYVKFRLSKDYGTVYKNDVMFNLGAFETPYKPYLATSTKDFNLNLDGAGTVGDEAILTEDPSTGLFKVNTITKTERITLKDLTWYKDSKNNQFYSTSLEGIAKAPTNQSEIAQMICSHYDVGSYYHIYTLADEFGISLHKSDTTYLTVHDRIINDLDTFKQFLIDSDVVLVCELINQTEGSIDDLTLDDVSVTGQQGGEITVNTDPSLGPTLPTEISAKFNIKYHEEV